MRMHATTVQISGEITSSIALDALVSALTKDLLGAAEEGKERLRNRLLAHQDDGHGKRPFSVSDQCVFGRVSAIVDVATTHRIDMLFTVHDGDRADVFYVDKGERSMTVIRLGNDIAVNEAMIAEMSAKGIDTTSQLREHLATFRWSGRSPFSVAQSAR